MNELKREIYNLGASIVGFADLKDCIPKEFDKYPYGISIAVKLDDKIIDKIKNGPTMEYSKHYREINDKLNLIAGEIKKNIEENGHHAFIIEASNIVDETNLKGLLPHKLIATRAGLGWIGKNDLLVTSEYGPRIRLVSVLTDMQLKTATPVNESKCGECRVCLINCPSKAIKNVIWDVSKARKDILDVEACHEITKINKKKVGHRICGICISVCPKGTKK